MKMPWTRRAEEAEEAAQQADATLHAVEGQWPIVNRSTEPALQQARLNGWTETAKRLMGGAAT